MSGFEALPAAYQALAAAIAAEGATAGATAAGTAGLGAGTAAGTGLLGAGATAAGTGMAGLTAAEIAAAEAAASGGLLADAAYGAMVPGVGSQQAGMLAAQTGDFGAYGLGKTMEAAAGAQGLNPATASAARVGGGLLSQFGAGSSAKAAPLMTQMGLQMMQPPPPQPMPQSRPMQASQEPLPSPYGVGGNSMEGPPPGMTWEEWMKRKQMMMGRM